MIAGGTTMSGDLRDEAAEVAYLTHRGIPQFEIAKALGISQSTVSRLLREATDSKVLRTRTEFASSHISEDLLQRIAQRWDYYAEARDLLKKLNEELGFKTLKRVLIPRLPSESMAVGDQLATSAGSRDHKDISRAAASYMAHRFSALTHVGVLPGRTVRSLAGSLRHYAGLTQSGITFVPLTGLPYFLEGEYPIELSATEVAKSFARAVNLTARTQSGKSKELIDINSIPICIPKNHKNSERINSAEIKTLKHFFTELPNYNRVYGDREGQGGLMAEVEMVVTSVGAVDRGSPWYGNYLKNTIGLSSKRGDPLDIARYVAGEIGCVFLPLPGGSRSQRSAAEHLEEVETRWIAGPRLGDLQRMADRLPEAGKPGVIVIAHGAAKAEVLYSAIQHRCVNEVIIDLPLADRLKSMVDKAIAAKARA